MIRIVADVHIPHIASFLGDVGQLRLISGRAINREDVKDADILVVRSVTRVDEALLEGTRVRMVATATSGVDHVDRDYLARAGVVFSSAPGANAESVVEYVLAALYALSVEHGTSVDERKIGIVGFGQVGSRLARRLKAGGARVLVNDPPLEDAVGPFAPGFEVVSLESLLKESDVVTLHVPLERETEHPTWHLIDEAALSAMRPGAWLINTSRGEVVSESDLLAHAADSAAGPLVLDVWSTEPEPHPALVDASRISTPHIAGYAWDAKLEATRMMADAVRAFLRLPVLARDRTDEVIPLTSPDSSAGRARWYHSVIRQMYDIDAESKRFRSEILGARSPGSVFSRFRNEYPRRRSFRCYGLRSSEIPPEYAQVADALGIRVVE